MLKPFKSMSNILDLANHFSFCWKSWVTSSSQSPLSCSESRDQTRRWMSWRRPILHVKAASLARGHFEKFPLDIVTTLYRFEPPSSLLSRFILVEEVMWMWKQPSFLSISGSDMLEEVRLYKLESWSKRSNNLYLDKGMKCSNLVHD